MKTAKYRGGLQVGQPVRIRVRQRVLQGARQQATCKLKSIYVYSFISLIHFERFCTILGVRQILCR